MTKWRSWWDENDRHGSPFTHESYTEVTSTPTPRPVPQPRPTGEWETHLCELPPLESLPSNGVTALGQVWRCDCERRWQIVEFNRTQRGEIRSVSWQELMSAAPITDDELERLLQTVEDDDDPA